MEHIGIDLGATHSHVVVISEAGDLLRRRKLKTTQLETWLKMRGESRVVMEACTQSPAVARLAMDAGHQVRVVPGALVRALGVGARGIKTDDRDAEVLARASLRNEELPSVHLKSERSRSRRELLSARASLLDARRDIALSVKSWLRGRLVMLKGRANTPAFCEAVRQAALAHKDGLPMAIETQLETFEHLCGQLAKLEEEIKRITSKDEVCRRLMTIPGVGPQVALTFTSQVDDPGRFHNADHVGSYLALVPGEATTGGKVKRTGTLKAGPLRLKALLVQGAWSMWRSRPCDPMVVWARELAQRRGTRIAIVALARKLATVMWSMWKHGTAYDPSRASSARYQPPSEQVAGGASSAPPSREQAKPKRAASRPRTARPSSEQARQTMR